MQMLNPISLAVALAITVSAFAQDRKVTVADFVGTWNIEMMSHQIALVVEPAEGNTVTATMMMPMGAPEVLLKGELNERTLTLTGAEPGATSPKPIIVTLQDDGTIVGEMLTNRGPAKWTGEKLKTKKKG